MNAPHPRRVFLMTLAASGMALATSAQAQAVVDEKDAQAVALGHTIVTDNEREFARVAELPCESWLREAP